MSDPSAVLLFTDADVFAGTERHIADLGAALRRLGVDVVIGCPAPSPLAERATAAGIRVLAIAKRGAYDRAAIRTVAAFLREDPRRIVHCHNGRTALIATLARARARQGRVVLTQHFLSPSYATRRGWKKHVSDLLHRWVDGRTDHVIAISDVVRDGVIDRGEASPDRVTRVHNGAATDAAPVDRATARATLDVPQDRPLLFCAARLEPEKRVEVLIDAMCAVRETMPQVRCVVAGQGKQEATLGEKIASAGLDQAVTLLGFRSDVPTWMASADVFVLPAEAEPFGLVVLEAMAASVPVIATDAGGPREIVVPGQTGWLVRPNDPTAMAEAITEAFRDPSRTASMGRAGRERLLRHFTAERMARETLAVYRQVVAAAQSAGAVAVAP